MAITGRKLRIERRLKNVTVVDVAARMGLSRQAVHVLEGMAEPSPERVEQYRKALRDAIAASKAKVA